MTRAGGALIVAALALAGCSSAGTDYGAYWKVMRRTLSGSFHDQGITLKQAAAIPYASMGWRLNGGAQQIIVLATDQDQQIWTSASHIVLQTRDGRITRTVGLPHDLAGLGSHSNEPLASPARALTGTFSDHRVADFPDAGAYNIALDCTVRMRGTQPVTILGKQLHTIRIDESCVSNARNWRFTNNYWVTNDGFVWRSLQHIHPSGDTIATEIFRPPG